MEGEFEKIMEKKCMMYREVLRPEWEGFPWSETPKGKQLERPNFFKQYSSEIVVELDQDLVGIEKHSLMEVIQGRRSIREYSDKPLSFKEFSYLVTNTCKTVKISKDRALSLGVIPVPGAIKSIETYIYVKEVEGMKMGLYHYNLLDNKLYLIKTDISHELINEVMRNQTKGAQVVFFWTTSPARTEYKYSYLAHKMIAMEAGHTCQNLYLACGCLDLGTVAIGAYSQEKCDEFLGIDGEEEFTIYIAPVGHLKVPTEK